MLLVDLLELTVEKERAASCKENVDMGVERADEHM